MPRLKVFQAHLGFFDTVVAAPSKKAALEAWGSRQDLFRDGTAAIATDPKAVRAAVEKPGVVLKRLSGSKDDFVEQPDLPKTGPVSRAKPTKNHATKQPARKPDRSKLDAAEHALKELKQRRQQARAEFAEREKSLRQQKQAQEQQFDDEEAELQRRLAAERKAYNAALKK